MLAAILASGLAFFVLKFVMAYKGSRAAPEKQTPAPGQVTATSHAGQRSANRDADQGESDRADALQDGPDFAYTEEEEQAIAADRVRCMRISCAASQISMMYHEARDTGSRADLCLYVAFCHACACSFFSLHDAKGRSH